MKKFMKFNLMDDKVLLTISLIMSVVGLIGLYFIIQIVDIPISDISSLDSSMVGKTVRIQGNVTSLTEKNNNVFMKINDGSEITAIIFNADIKVEIGQNISVKGTLDEYENELEIIASDVS